VPADMMRELLSVLTLRKQHKEKRRQQKRARLGHLPEPVRTHEDPVPDRLGHLPDSQRKDTSREHGDIDMSNITQEPLYDGPVPEPVRTHEDPVPDPSSTGEDPIPDPPSTPELSPFQPHPLSSQLLTAILQRRHVNQEETYS